MNKKLVGTAVAVLVSAALALVALPADANSELRCNSDINGGTYSRVVVVPGDACFLLGVTVKGDVVVNSGGLLATENGARINGNVTVRPGDSGGWLVNSTVGGNFHCNRAEQGCQVVGTAVNGNVSMMNSKLFNEVSESSTIGGSVSLFNNESAILGNSRINGNLSCFGNEIVDLGEGGPLDVRGNRSGQC